MNCTEIITVIAIVVGPIAAVQIEKLLERNRNSRNRRESVFKTLMATRGTVLSYAHVEALNRIDLEFSNNKQYKKVIESWKEYFDNLSQNVSNEKLESWHEKNIELLSNLLYEMGKALNYDFDKVLIKRNVYSPAGHNYIEREQQDIRKGLIDFINGEKIIPITFVQDTESIETQKELQKIMLEYYSSNIKKDK